MQRARAEPPADRNEEPVADPDRLLHLTPARPCGRSFHPRPTLIGRPTRAFEPEEPLDRTILPAIALALACASDTPSWLTYQTAGEAAVRHARYEKAESLFEEALAGSGEQRDERVRSLAGLARVARELGDFPLARERLAAARELAAAGIAPAELVRLDLEAAWLALAEGQAEQAADAFELTGALAERVLGDDDPALGWAAAGRGEALRRTVDRAGARAALDDALARFQGDADADSMKPEDPLGLLAVLTSLGALLRTEGSLEEARGALRTGLLLGARELGTDHPRLADALAELALVELARGDLEAARRAAARADEIARSRLPEGHATRLAAADALARCGPP